MDTARLISASPAPSTRAQTSGITPPPADTRETKSFKGFLKVLANASGNPEASVVVKKQGADAPKMTPAKLAETLDGQTSIEGLIAMLPGATSEQIAEVKASFSANLNSLEKAMKNVLQEYGIPNPDVRVLPREMVMVDIPPEAMAQLSTVLGSFIAAFDSMEGTNFAQNFKISMENLTQTDNGDLDINFAGFTPKNPAQLVEAAIATVATMAGVDRPVKNSSITSTQNLLMAQSVTSKKGALDTPFAITTQSALTANPKAMKPVQKGEVWSPDNTMATGLKSFLKGTLETVKAASETNNKGTNLTGDTSPANVVSGADKKPMLPGLNFMRPADLTLTGTFDTFTPTSTASVPAEEFEEMMSQSGKVKTSSELLTQAQSSRFSAMINNQIKSFELGERKTRIELAPKGLGEIEINLETDEAGKMRALIRVENPLVLDLMRSDKSQLVDLLAQKGVDLGDGSLDLEGFENQSDDEAGSQTGSAEIDGSDEDEITQTAAVHTITDTTVDILT